MKLLNRNENRKVETKLSAHYIMEIASDKPDTPPEYRSFTVKSAGINETLNVIRRLVESSPRGTKLKSFTLFAPDTNHTDVINCARSIASCSLSKDPNENVISFHQETNTSGGTAPCPADQGCQHPDPSGVDSADPQ